MHRTTPSPMVYGSSALLAARGLKRTAFRGALMVLVVWGLGCKVAGFKDAYMALDGAGRHKRDVFYTDTDAIYCVVEMASGVDDVTVTGKLRTRALYDEFTGERADINALVGVEEQRPGAGENLRLGFQLDKQGQPLYQAGLWTCDLFLDGTREASLDFEIRYRTCPLAPIDPEDSCAGLVVRESECPGAVEDVTCACTADAGVWDCR